MGLIQEKDYRSDNIGLSYYKTLIDIKTDEKSLALHSIHDISRTFLNDPSIDVWCERGPILRNIEKI